MQIYMNLKGRKIRRRDEGDIKREKMQIERSERGVKGSQKWRGDGERIENMLSLGNYFQIGALIKVFYLMKKKKKLIIFSC